MPKPTDGSLVNVLVESKKIKDIGKSETIVVDVPKLATTVELIVKRNSWPDTGSNVMQAQLWISYDSGRKYSFLIGFRTAGGPIPNKDGIPAPSSRVSRHMKPQYKTHIRKVKILIDNFIPLDMETQLEFW